MVNCAATSPDKVVEAWTILSSTSLRNQEKYLSLINSLPKTWSYITNGNGLKVISNTGVELADISEQLIKCKAGNPDDCWNVFLNKPTIPNQKYDVDNIIFETDNQGRVNKVSGRLDAVERGRNEYQQGISVELKGGTKGEDDGGHLIANILNGPGEQINYLPMNSTLNRGDWKSMEGEWRKVLQEGKTVQVEIKPIFEGSSKRPVSFQVDYWIDGNRQRKFFDN